MCWVWGSKTEERLFGDVWKKFRFWDTSVLGVGSKAEERQFQQHRKRALEMSGKKFRFWGTSVLGVGSEA